MDIVEIIRRQDLEIDEAKLTLAEAEARAASAGRALADAQLRLDGLVKERSMLIHTAERFGAVESPTSDEVPTPPSRSEWMEFTRLDAVENALDRNGPMHINEIVEFLRESGRSGDDYPLVSATLATLRSRRGSVKPLGKGRWEFIAGGKELRVSLEKQADEARARIGALGLPPQIEETPTGEEVTE